jgi:hypothetical protein
MIAHSTTKPTVARKLDRALKVRKEILGKKNDLHSCKSFILKV